MMTSSLFGIVTIVSLVLAFVFGALAFVFTNRLLNRRGVPIGEEIGSYAAVLRKVRKREPMSTDELDLARQVIGDRLSLLAYSIPAALFCLGAFYVFGSLEHLHGATPSERTFLGVIPMITSTNLAIQLLKVARLKGRLNSTVIQGPPDAHTTPLPAQ
jgi:Kef-type K+ transport system membrane component KefB